MKLGTAYVPQIAKEAGGFTEQQLRSIITAVSTGYHTEHNVNDTHKIIHASGSIFERSRTLYAIGDTIPVPFVPADYTASGAMTWTVTAAMVTNFTYALIGPRMFVDFDITGSTVGGAANTALQVKIPGGWFATRTTRNPCKILDNAVAAVGVAQVAAMGRVIQFVRNDAANWTTGATNNNVHGQISFEVRTA